MDPSTGDVWLATFGGGIVRYTAGRFDTFDQFNSGLAGDIVFDIAVAHDRVWAATSGGVSAYRPARAEWALYLDRRADGVQQAWAAFQLRGDELVVFATSGALRRYDTTRNTWVETRTSKNQPLAPPLQIAPCGNENSRSTAIAVYGPRNRTITLPGSPPRLAADPGRADLAAIEVAVAQARDVAIENGGEPIPLLRTSAGYARYGWTLPEDDYALFAIDPRIHGVVGHLSPSVQPILAEVVARTHLPFVTTAPYRPEDEHGLGPDVAAFRCYGGIKRAHRMLHHYLRVREGVTLVSIVKPRDSADALRAGWWRQLVTVFDLGKVHELDACTTPREIRAATERVAAVKPDLLFTWTDPEETVRLVTSLREAGVTCPVIVSSRCLRDDIASLADGPLGRLISFNESQAHASPLNPDVVRGFQQAYRERAFTAPATYDGALRSYAAADHLLHAVKNAKGGREEVAERLHGLQVNVWGENHYEERFSAEPIIIGELTTGGWTYKSLLPD